MYKEICSIETVKKLKIFPNFSACFTIRIIKLLDSQPYNYHTLLKFIKTEGYSKFAPGIKMRKAYDHTIGSQ